MRFVVILAVLFSSLLNAQEQIFSSDILKRNSVGCSVLDDACFSEKIDVIKEWFEAIADNEGTSAVCKCIKSSDQDGYTPMMLACAHNYVQKMSVYSYLVETLGTCEAESSTCDYIQHQSSDGKTALMLASKCGNFEIVQYLVVYVESVEGTKGAVEYIKLKDSEGSDAVSMSGYNKITTYLEQYLETNDR
jgi:ankyrin repeat protein